MERYNVPEHGYSDSYLIHGTGSNPQLTSSLVEQFEAMYNEGNPELLVDQGLYYPTATNYGYICTGFESPGDWDEHQRVLGQDGQDIQYAGARTESLPCVYYTPSYGYSQSPYNPYNPYIPGAMLGVDGPLVGTQQYYTIPSYETPVPSPAYFPMAVQPRPDLISNASTDSFLDTTASTGSHFKNNLSPAAPTFILTPPWPASNKATLARVSEGIEANAGSSRQSTAHTIITSTSLSSPKSQVHLGKGSHALDNNGLHGKAMSSRDQLKVVIPSGVGGVCLPNYGSNASGRGTLDKPRFYYNRVSNDANEDPDALVELNRGPRTSKLKDHLTVKAYTTKAGDTDERGNIIIYTDQYNRDDIATDYVNAKFFVIKSYSEDDVHKSVKYNVWSSTPNGNKKLNSAYEDAQRIASGEAKCCPVFLFFSVNASGQFCGVAEMHGPVNFHRDMDFWQQDKWSGSFNVKWHIIKDVPNPNFRHILLENNENKPVTNSRDTQEIRYKKGMDMLKIFKTYTSKTSLLDDFMYYENQQKMLQEEKARLLFNTFQGPLIASVIDPPERKSVLAAANVDMKNVYPKDMSNSKEKVGSALTEQVPKNLVINNADIANANAADDIENGKTNEDSMLKIGLPTIKPKQSESNLSEASTTVSAKEGFGEAVDVVTVGSMPIKVNGFGQSPGFLTVGTIPLDPRSLGVDGIGGFSKAESHKG